MPEASPHPSSPTRPLLSEQPDQRRGRHVGQHHRERGSSAKAATRRPVSIRRPSPESRKPGHPPTPGSLRRRRANRPMASHQQEPSHPGSEQLFGRHHHMRGAAGQKGAGRRTLELPDIPGGRPGQGRQPQPRPGVRRQLERRPHEPPLYPRPHPVDALDLPSIAPGVDSQSLGGLLDRTLQHHLSVVERMGEGDGRMNPAQPVLGQGKPAKEGRAPPERVGSRTDVMTKLPKGQLRSPASATDGLGGFHDQRRTPRLCQDDRGRQAVRARSDHYRVIRHTRFSR